MPSEVGGGELELRDYLHVLRRRRWVVIATMLVVTAAALVASLVQRPVYEGTAELLLELRAPESIFDPNTGQRYDSARAVDTEIEVLKSEPVRAAVRRELRTAPAVSATPVGDTDVIEVRARSTEPKEAAAVANAYANAYIDFRRQKAVDTLLAAGKEIQETVADLQRQIDGLDAQVNSAPPPVRAQLEQSMVSSRQSLLSQQSLFRQKLEQLQVDAALKSGGAQVVTPASVPDSPVEPTPKRDAALALTVGLMLGVGLAFLFDYLDDSLKTKEDVERVTPGVPALALIPAVTTWKNREEPQVVSISEPKSPAAEAYRVLRTSIQFLSLDRPMRTIQVTSPAVSEGKSTTIANLGYALANAGQNVVIVCCDLRRPRIHKFFGLDNAVGLTSVMLGEVPLDAALQDVLDVERLQVLASGPPPPNPAELLSSRRAVEVITAAQARADVVLVDCPPVLPVTDAAVLSSRVDATLLVATAGRTTRRELQRAYELLAQVDAPIIGTVLNGVKGEGAYGYYRYAYAYSYTADAEDPGRTGASTRTTV
jgi:succinoglycan biosynthesis transport protein ExoP